MRNVIIKLFVFSVILFVVIKVIIGFIENSHTLDEYLPSTYTYSSDDSALLSPIYIDSMDIIEKYKSAVRNPVTLLKYKKANTILYYRFDSIENIDLSSIKMIEKSADRSIGISYRIIVNNDLKLKFQYKGGQLKRSSSLFLTLSGDSLKSIVSNDSLLGYSLGFENMSIRYGANDPVDIFIENTGNVITKPKRRLNIFLLKKLSGVYLLITPELSKEGNFEQEFPGRLFANIDREKNSSETVIISS